MPAKIDLTDGTEAVLERLGIDSKDGRPTVPEAREMTEALRGREADEVAGAFMEIEMAIHEKTDPDWACDLCGAPATRRRSGMTGTFPVCDDHAPEPDPRPEPHNDGSPRRTRYPL